MGACSNAALLILMGACCAAAQLVACVRAQAHVLLSVGPAAPDAVR